MHTYKTILVVGLVVLLASCWDFSNKQKDENRVDQMEKLDIGTSFESIKNCITDSTYFIVTPSGNIEKSYTLIISNIKSQVVLDKKNMIQFISTSDAKFISPEGIKIRMPFIEVAERNKNAKVNEIMGWAKFVKQQSGWYVAFPFDSNIEKSNVSFIFKYKF